MTALRASLAVGLVVLASAALAGCGGSSQAAQPNRDCLQAWNARTNAANHTRVAGAYTYAKVVSAEQTCAFAFHGDDPPLLLLTGRWQGDRLVLAQNRAARGLGARLPHGTPPSSEDNAVVTPAGWLLPGSFPRSTRIAKPAGAPRWLLIRARRDAVLYRDPSPRAIEISLRRDLWRVVLRGSFICESCFVPVGQPKPKSTVIEEFDPHTRAGAGISYG
jgi:hypothetical protein